MPEKLLLVCLSLLAALIAGCAHHPASSNPASTKGTRTFLSRGVVHEVSLDHREAVIRHEPIPGYMPGMTMTFNVQSPSELDGVEPGDKVSFRLLVNDATHWIEDVRRVGHAATKTTINAHLSTNSFVSELKIGDTLPDCELFGEHGKPVRFSDFRGRVLAFTFIFTRCPIPNYCPLMSRQFARTRTLLKARSAAPANWQFLSISFDPDFDKPAVLASHARLYRGEDGDRWLFASASTEVLSKLAPQLGLEISRQRGNLSHNLRTIVLDAQGRIHSRFIGNQWAPEALAESIVQARHVGEAR